MPMRILDLKPGDFPAIRVAPRIFLPVAEAVSQGRDVVDVVRAIVESLGFDSFAFGLATNPRPDRETQLYAFTTMPAEWMMLYDKNAYVEVDPRVQYIYDSTLPMIWDQSDVRGRSARCDEFLDDAARYGTRSGVAFTLHDVGHGGIMIAYNSKLPNIDAARLRMIQKNLPDLLSFGHYFHEWFIKSVVAKGSPSRLKGAPLSARERGVLGMVAHGLTSADIAYKLSISERTVQFHLTSVRTKLGAANRQEAVALGMQQGLVTART
ncbi:MAG: LuxR family transcriptional regulator [Betaproteobacteria bacterium]